MQERHARQLRHEWGGKLCAHPAFDRLMLGSLYDGYVCIRCGQEFTQEQRDQVVTRRKEDPSRPR